MRDSVFTADSYFYTDRPATDLRILFEYGFRLVDRRVGTAKHEMRVVFRAPDDAAAEAATAALVAAGASLAAYSATPVEGGGVRRSLRIDTSAPLARPGPVLKLLCGVPGIVPETVE